MKTNIKTKTWDDVRRTARRILPAVGLLSLGLLATRPVGNVAAETVQSWGPQDRPTYTWETPADHRTFNSITNNPSLGDERNFVRVCETAAAEHCKDEIAVEAGKVYTVYVYYHNNASASLNKSGAGIADDVTLRMNMPEVITAGKKAMVKGTIHSSNASPTEVWDTAYFSSKEQVYLRYIDGTAQVHTAGTANGEYLDDASLWSDSGAKLAYYKEHWGIIPGCNEFAGYVTFQVKVDQPGFYMEKTASKEGKNNYAETITVAPGDTIDFKIRYHNTGTTIQSGVLSYDKLANGMQMVPGTTYTETPDGRGFETTDNLFNGGIVIGDFMPGEQAFITYKVKIVDDAELFKCGETVIYNNSAVATANGTEHDAVKVTVKRDCNEPKYCDGVGEYAGQKFPEGDARCEETVTEYCDGVGDYEGQKFPKGDARCEMPHTGPTEIVLALLIITGIGTGVAYYIASKKQLNSLQKSSK